MKIIIKFFMFVLMLNMPSFAAVNELGSTNAEVPSNPRIHKTLIETSQLLAVSKNSCEEYLHTKVQLNKLLKIAGYDRVAILNEIIHCSMYMKGGVSDELTMYGLQGLLIYLNFTDQEAIDATSPYIETNNEDLRKINEAIRHYTKIKTYKKYRDKMPAAKILDEIDIEKNCKDSI